MGAYKKGLEHDNYVTCFFEQVLCGPEYFEGNFFLDRLVLCLVVIFYKNVEILVLLGHR